MRDITLCLNHHRLVFFLPALKVLETTRGVASGKSETPDTAWCCLGQPAARSLACPEGGGGGESWETKQKNAERGAKHVRKGWDMTFTEYYAVRVGTSRVEFGVRTTNGFVYMAQVETSEGAIVVGGIEDIRPTDQWEPGLDS